MLCICTSKIVFDSLCHCSIYVLIIIYVRALHNKHKENICTKIIRRKIIQETQMHNNVYDYRKIDFDFVLNTMLLAFCAKIMYNGI